MLRTFVWAAAASMLFHAQCASAGHPRFDDIDRPIVGVVLGGGGARGLAHIGVLQVLEEMRIPVDLIVGTSAGSIVGGFYATGMSAGELDAVLTGINWNRMFTDQTERSNRSFRRKRDDDFGMPGPKVGLNRHGIVLTDGMLTGQNIMLYLQAVVAARAHTHDFDDLPIPYRAMASDLETGASVVLRDGSLAQAMRASMSLPGIFSPVRQNGRLLVDGGIGNNLPVDVARELGADIVIAVDVSTPPAATEALSDLTAVTEQLSRLLVYPSTQVQLDSLTDNDVLIRPDMDGTLSSASFTAAAASAVPIGVAAARAKATLLAPLALTEAEYDAHIEARRSRIDSPLGRPITAIVMDNRSSFANQVILEKLDAKVGDPFETEALERSIGLIHSLGYFKEVSYDFVPANGGTDLQLTVVPDERAPHLLEYGASISGDGSDNRFALRLGYLQTNMDRLGSELRVFAQAGDTAMLAMEWYRPLEPSLRYFLLPQAYVRRRSIDVFAVSGNQLGTVRDLRTGGVFAGGYEPDRTHSLLAGFERYTGRLSEHSGVGLLENYRFDGAEIFMRLRRDTLDDRYLPTDGSAFEFDWTASRGILGADDSYDQLRISYTASASWGRNVLTLSARAATTLGSDAPLHALFGAGGFGNLSGLRDNQLFGQHMGIAVIDLRRRVFQSNLLPGFLGLSLEYGNVWDRRGDIDLDDGRFNAALYFGYRSPIGPLIFGYGAGESGAGTFFLNLGRRY